MPERPPGTARASSRLGILPAPEVRSRHADLHALAARYRVPRCARRFLRSTRWAREIHPRRWQRYRAGHGVVRAVG